jgi:hypothetical protein
VQLRDGSVRIDREQRSAWIVLGVLAMAGAGAVAAMWTLDRDPLVPRRIHRDDRRRDPRDRAGPGRGGAPGRAGAAEHGDHGG